MPLWLIVVCAGSLALCGWLRERYLNSVLRNPVNTDLQGLTILLPQLVDSEGYILYFVNTTNTAQVYAASQPFTIAVGQAPTTVASASGAGASTVTVSSGNIPGPYTVSRGSGI